MGQNVRLSCGEQLAQPLCVEDPGLRDGAISHHKDLSLKRNLSRLSSRRDARHGKGAPRDHDIAAI